MNQRIILLDDYNSKCDTQLKTDGASTKTENVFQYLSQKYSNFEVKRVYLPSWKKHPISNFFKFISSIKKGDVVFLLPNEARLGLYQKLFSLKKEIAIFYMVVGGWLPDCLENKRKALSFCDKMTGIFPETKQMVDRLEKLGLKNAYYSPVFSLQTNPIKKDNYVFDETKPINVCTFSRVDREKGIAIAIEAVNIANSVLKKKAFFLNVYGRIMNKEEETFFNEFFSKNKDMCKYYGPIKSNDVVDTLNQNFALIFPTYFWGEGFPGTLLEAYRSSIPVIASDWKYNNELVDDGVSGYLFESKNVQKLANILVECYNNPKHILNMRNKCLEIGKMFTSEYCMKNVDDLLLKVTGVVK